MARDSRYFYPNFDYGGPTLRRGDTATDELLNQFASSTNNASLAPGKQFNDRQFVITGGTGYESDWGNWSPGPEYQKLADIGDRSSSTPMMAWFRAGQPQAAAAPPPPPAPEPPRPQAQNPVPLAIGPSSGGFQNPYQSEIAELLKIMANQSMAPAPTIKIEQPKPNFNASAAVDGNAMGFTRAKSSARKAGLTTKGTSRLRITRGQTTASSGLNIGV